MKANSRSIWVLSTQRIQFTSAGTGTTQFYSQMQRRWASKKTDKPKVAGWNKSLKQPSKRKGKYYKLKTHKGAAQRWQVVGSSSQVGLKRARCGQSHLRRKTQGWKKRALRERVLANAQQRNFLKKLLPYHGKRYSRL